MTKFADIGGVTMPYPFMIGAGASKDPESTKRWLKVATTVSGSYTPGDIRRGNDTSRLFWPDDLETFLAARKAYNWFGMPNMGSDRMPGAFGEEKFAHPLIVSFAAFSIESYVEVANIIDNMPNVAAKEANVGCQNTEHGKPLSFYIDGLQELLEALPSGGKPTWIKLSPYWDKTYDLLPEVADLVNTYRHKIQAVVECNTYLEEAGKDKISSPDGFASKSGPEIEEMSLDNFDRFRNYLVDEIDVINVGGIVSGKGIVARLERGASGVQLVTVPYLLGDPSRLNDHLLEDGALLPFLEKEGYL